VDHVFTNAVEFENTICIDNKRVRVEAVLTTAPAANILALSQINSRALKLRCWEAVWEDAKERGREGT
jgi:hypothetical protein